MPAKQKQQWISFVWLMFLEITKIHEWYIFYLMYDAEEEHPNLFQTVLRIWKSVSFVWCTFSNTRKLNVFWMLYPDQNEMTVMPLFEACF